MDYKNPDYTLIFKRRSEILKKIREDSSGKLLESMKIHYRYNPWDFINDWGMTFEPRNIAKGLLAHIPFVLWQRQREYLEWIEKMWRTGNRGLVEKSRDCGVTWLSVGYAVAKFLFEPGFTAGFGSRKEELVDKKGDDKSIFQKTRVFLEGIPPEFYPAGFSWREHSAHTKILNPETRAAIIGESGDEIGRGGRTSMYFVDEAAFVEHQDLVDAALSQNTDCQIDISTPNGNGNPFYFKRMRIESTLERLFVFDWRDDPRKDQAWYDRQCELFDEVIVAQEIDRDYDASNEDAFIPAKAVKLCVDAHEVLGIEPSGVRVFSFDPADTGDAKGGLGRYGPIIVAAEEFTSGDITQAIPWAYHCADMMRADILVFDADGMGAPAMKLSFEKKGAGRYKVVPYRGSEKPENPGQKYGIKKDMTPEEMAGLKTNAEMFVNKRGQMCTKLRDKVMFTASMVARAKKGQLVRAEEDDIISFSSKCKHFTQLISQLSRPKRVFTDNGKIRCETKKEMKARGVASPNLFDCAVMANSVKGPEREIIDPYRDREVLDPEVGY